MKSLIYNIGHTAKFLALGVLLVVLALPANADFNQQINYQGKLVSNTGVAVTNGNYPVVFQLYTAATSGVAVWTENRFGANQVSVTSGLFSVMLGSVTSLSGVDFNQTLYLGVTVASDTEMLPRKVLGTVPAAFESKNTQTLGGLASTSFVRTDRDSVIASTTASTLLTITQNGTGNILDLLDGVVNVFTVRDGGNIGIGTTTPNSKLTVGGNAYFAGNITATGTLAITGTSTLGTTTANNLSLTQALAATSGGTSLSTIAQNQLLIGGAGNSWSQIATSSLGLSGSFTTSAGLAALLSDESGTGSVVYSDSSTLTSTTTAANIVMSGRLVVNALVASRALFLDGAKGLTTSGASLALSAALSDETGSGAAVFAVSPAFTGTTTFANVDIAGTSTLATTTINNLALTQALGVLSGGTSFNAYATGDFLYASGANTLAKRTIGSAGDVLSVVGGVPSWVATSTLGFSNSLFTDGGNSSVYLSSLTNRLLIGTSTLPTTATNTRMAISNGRLLVTQNSPVKLGGVEVPGSIAGDNIAFQNQYAYIGSATSFFVYKTQEPSSMTTVSSASTSANILSMTINGNYLYVAVSSTTNNIEIYDISNPSSVSRVAVFTALGGNGLLKIEARGGYLYTNTNTTFYAYDLSNPKLPLFVDSIATAASTVEFQIQGNYAYVTSANVTGSADLTIIDIRVPSDIRSISATNLGLSLVGTLAVRGNYVYTSAGGTNFHVVDVSNLATPVTVATVAIGASTVNKIELSGDYAYLFRSTTNDVAVYNIASSTAPSLVTSIATAHNALSGTIKGNYLYVGTANAGADDFEIFDLGGFKTPTGDIGTLLADMINVGALESDSIRIFNSLNVGNNALIDGQLSITGAASSSLLTATNTYPALVVATGNTVLGTTTGAARLTVRATSTQDIVNLFDAAGTSVLTAIANGNVGIGSSTPTAKLSVGGTLAVTGTSTFSTTTVASSTVGTLNLGNALSLFSGGTGFNAYAAGDFLYASGVNTLAKRTIGTAGDVLSVVGGVPTWVATSTLGISGGSSFTTSAQLAALLSDETGSAGGGLAVFSNAPTFTTNITTPLVLGGTAATSTLTLQTTSGVGSTDAIIFKGGTNGATLLGMLDLGSTNNVAFGADAGATFGALATYNVALGFEAGRYASTTAADDSNYIGRAAGRQNSGAQNNLMGYFAGYNNAGTANNIFGASAGYNNTGSSSNLFGEFAGYNNTGSLSNIFGESAGRFNTGSQNNIFGDSAGSNNTGSQNNLFGNSAGRQNIGLENNIFGSTAGYWNTGSQNNFFGNSAGVNNTGSYNNYFGPSAGADATGSNNNAFGRYAGRNTTGSYSELFGYEAGGRMSASYSVAIGGLALRGGSGNTNLGNAATTTNNTAVGYGAGYNLLTGGDNNILFGYQAADNMTTGNNNIVIGYDIDAVTATADNQLNIGNLIFGTGIDGVGATLSSGNIGIGTTTPGSKLTVSGNAYFAGNVSATGTLTATGGYYIGAIPAITGSTTARNFFMAGASSTTFTSATDNYGIGRSVFNNLTTGTYNVAAGESAMKYVTSGFNNVAFGRQALFGSSTGFMTGSDNNALGGFTLNVNNTGSFNNAFGYIALVANTTGSYNNAFGRGALASNTSGLNNTAIGQSSMNTNTTGSYNVAIGYNSLYLNTNGSYNSVMGSGALYSNVGTGTIAIGYQTADNALTVDRGIFIGYNIDPASNSADDVLNIGNIIFGTGVDGTGTTLSSGNIGIGTSTPSSRLTVGGAGYFAGNLTATGTLAITGTSTLATTTISSSTITTLNLTNALAALSGGTGFSTYATGDFLYASGANTLAKRTIGTAGDVLSVVGGVPSWVATSTLGISGGAGATTFLALTDTPSSFTANRIMYTNSGATALVDSANLTFNGATFALAGNARVDLNDKLLYASSTSNALVFGRDSWRDVGVGTNGISIGARGLWQATASAESNIAIGNDTGENVTSGSYNLLIGPAFTGSNITTGNFNTFIGYAAGSENRISSGLTLVGFNAGNRLREGANDVFVGGYTGRYLATTTDSAIVGDYAAYGQSAVDFEANRLTIMGVSAGYSLQSGSDNNVFFGRRAGYAVTTGANNLLVGYQSGEALTTGSNNIALGYDIEFASNTASNQLNIGNLIFGTGIDGVGTTLSSGSVGVGTSTPQTKFSVAQSAASVGMSVYGYNTRANDFGSLSVDSNGQFVIRAGGLGAGLLTGAGNAPVFAWSDSLVATPDDKEYAVGNDLDYSLGYNSSDDTFRIVDGSNLATNPLLVINSTGNVGIGSTSPSSKLDVWGNFRVGTSSRPTLFVDTAAHGVAIGTTSLGTAHDLLVIENGQSGIGEVGIALKNVNDTRWSRIYQSNLGYLTFNTESTSIYESGGVEAFRVSWNGLTVNVGGAADKDFLAMGDTDTSLFFVDASADKVGIGTSSPVSKLSLQVNSFSAAGTAGFNRNYIFTNAASGTVQFGELGYIRASSSATSTIVGSMFRVEDSTIFGNTIRGLEVQTNRGTNTQGENTALSGFARTFGVRGYSSGDAGATFEPAGGFFETGGTTQGNAIRGYSSTITTGKLVSLFQDTSAFTGTGLLMNFGNSGGSFTATTSKFIDLQNAGASRFTVSAFGTTTIGDGTTNKLAGLQIGFGGLCVDNDGSCTASTSGKISSVSSVTGNSDLAEMYFSNENLLPGEIVYAKGELSVGRAAADTKHKIIGVVSTKPGVTLGFDDKSLTAGETGSPIALTGRVPIRLSNENGDVKVGDELMLSSIPGVAMKATGTGAIIGVALEDFDSGRAYSDTFVNQFGDDIIEPVYQPITAITDARINDGCYYGGGNATGEELCVPLRATSTDARVAEAAELAAKQARTAALRALTRTASAHTQTADGVSVRVGQIVMFVDLRYRYLDETNQTMLASLMLSSDEAMATIVGNENSVWGRLVTLAHNFVDGVLTIAGIKTDKVDTKELCVDGVCVTADDLRQMLEKNGQAGAPVQTSTEETDEGDDADSGTDDEEVAPPPTDPVIETPPDTNSDAGEEGTVIEVPTPDIPSDTGSDTSPVEPDSPSENPDSVDTTHAAEGDGGTLAPG